MVDWIKIPNHSDYQETLIFMEKSVDQIINNTMNDIIILTEHSEVITGGTSAYIEELLYNSSIPIIQTGRGGKYTYHGPGQRVIYPLIDLKLSPWHKDLKKYVNFLHLWIINSLFQIGISAHKRDDHIGIWVNKLGQDYKIAAIGIRARKWVAFHGIAVNINPKLENFDSFIPCGIRELGVTSIQEMGIKISFEEFDEILEKEYYNLLKTHEGA